MPLPLFRSLILSAGLVLCPGAVLSQSDFAPPATQAGEDGWAIYQDAPAIDKSTARGLTPSLDTAEGVVVAFLASRIRGDRDWRATRAADPGRKGKKAFNTWDDWTLTSARLVSRKDRGENRAYIRVNLALLIDGEAEGGEDDFEVVREGNGWRIKSPPS